METWTTAVPWWIDFDPHPPMGLVQKAPRPAPAKAGFAFFKEGVLVVRGFFFFFWARSRLNVGKTSMDFGPAGFPLKPRNPFRPKEHIWVSGSFGEMFGLRHVGRWYPCPGALREFKGDPFLGSKPSNSC